MSEHRSVWFATGVERQYGPLSADAAAEVVIVGAGITGLTTALLLQRQGVDVAVVEATTVAGGTTGGTTGKVTSQNGRIYADLVKSRGEHVARLFGEANQEAVETVARLAAEVAPDAAVERAPAYVYTRRPSEVDGLVTEAEVAARLGLPATFTTDTDLPFPVEGAVRFDDQLHFHAQRYCAGLADALVAAGGRIFDGTRALDVDEGPSGATVKTEHGNLTADRVVVATLLPFLDHGGFFAKARPSRSYGVAATLTGEPPRGMYISAGQPTRSVRPWFDHGHSGIIVVGEGHETGHEPDTQRFWGALERWAREHFAVESFEYRWSAQDYVTADHVPYVGRSPRLERTFVATGFMKWGLSNGTAAAILLSELLAGRDHPWLEVFDATRIGNAQAVGKMAKDNLHVGRRFVGDRIGRVKARTVSDLLPGEGAIVRIGRRTAGAYRDPSGEVHAVGVNCTHMGCTLQWNSGERSWDCPCHGSRFSIKGDVLGGPAVDPLPVVDPEGA